jgi:hypothetical protein
MSKARSSGVAFIRNDCYVGPPVTTSAAQEAGHAVSRLEQQYHAERTYDSGFILVHGRTDQSANQDVEGSFVRRRLGAVF